MLVLLFMLIASGCASSLTGDRRLNLWPLLNYYKDTEHRTTELDAIGPFFTLYSSPLEQRYGLRPLFFVNKNKEVSSTEIEYLFPLGKYRKKEKDSSFYLVPLFSSHKDSIDTQGKTHDFGMFPIFWGKDEDGNRYGGLFPIYGKLNHRFGKDQIRFYLWPFYLFSKDDDCSTHDILWPFFSCTKGENERGFKVWPLFGHYEKEGEFSRDFALWPIFFKQKTDLDTDNPKSTKAALPFFVQKKSPEKVSRSILWPFFNYSDDRKNEYKQWDMPWPLFQYGKGVELELFRFFPIYGYKRSADSKTGYFLFPLYTYSKDEFEDHKDTTYRLLLINKYQKKEFKKESRNAKSIRVWPLFYYNREKEDAIKFCFPEVIPLENEGFERNISPLFRLYEYNRDSHGNTESKLLWWLYRHKKSNTKELFEIAFLLDYEKEKDMSIFSFLKGIFEYKQGKEKKSIKLLYLPWRIKW
jgi:hypothetical protein